MREDIGLSFWIQLLPLICWPSLVLFIILKMTLFYLCDWRKLDCVSTAELKWLTASHQPSQCLQQNPRRNDSIHWLEHSINWSQNLTEQTRDPWRRAEGTGWGGVLGKVFPASSWLFSMWMYLCSQVCAYTCIQKGSKTDNYISVTTQNSLNVDFVGVYAFETGHHRSVQGDLELLRARITGVWKKTLSCLSLPSKGPILGFLFHNVMSCHWLPGLWLTHFRAVSESLVNFPCFRVVCWWTFPESCSMKSPRSYSASLPHARKTFLHCCFLLFPPPPPREAPASTYGQCSRTTLPEWFS